MSRDHINFELTKSAAPSALAALGLALKRLGPPEMDPRVHPRCRCRVEPINPWPLRDRPCSYAASTVGQMQRTIELGARRAAFRSRISGIRVRVIGLTHQANTDALLAMQHAQAAPSRFARRATLVLLWLAMFAGLAAIAASPIGGAA